MASRGSPQTVDDRPLRRRPVDDFSPEEGPPSVPGSSAPLLKERYILHREIGRGGMATVYSATDTALDRPVAVKLLLPHICREPRFVEAFLEMERRIARLFHPNLVTIFDAGVADEGCFVAMEYVPGGSLRDLLAAGNVLPVARVIKIVTQVAEALQVLHDEGIVHGDVKPDNVLLDEDGHAKLVDFGIAHIATTTGAVESRSLMGSAPYLAPEQLEHGRADARSDVYSLGLVLYELLASRRPFEGESWVAVAAQRLARDPDPLVEARAGLPAELDRVVMRALARDPNRRFGSAAALGAALRGIPLADPAPSGLARRRPRDVPPLRQTRDPLPWERESPLSIATEPPAQTAPAVARPPRRALARSAAVLRGLGQRGQSFRRRLPGLHPATLGLLALALALTIALLVPRLLDPPRAVTVPELTGQSVDAARGTAREAGMRLTTTEEPSETAPNGAILRQEPAAGTTIQSDQPVRLIVSSGPPPVRVPDLRQRRLDDARRDLAALGLALGKVEEREVSRRPWGVVDRQSVRPGGDLARGGVVDVVIAAPPSTNAPKLIDRALGEAQDDLERRGLRLGGVTLAPAHDKRAGTVLAQEPAADVRMRQGESVSVTVAVPAPPAAAGQQP
jgi:eukaryotic-like serine/threonine-protein kinase